MSDNNHPEISFQKRSESSHPRQKPPRLLIQKRSVSVDGVTKPLPEPPKKTPTKPSLSDNPIEVKEKTPKTSTKKRSPSRNKSKDKQQIITIPSPTSGNPS
jgi:hypothetical protein